MADDPEEQGEVVELEPEEAPEVEDTEDGGAIVRLPEDGPPTEGAFFDNLADTLLPDVLNDLGSKFIEYIGRDKESRAQRDKQYEEGIKRTGLGNDAPGGAQFQGASKVVHPMLTEVCVDFAARTIKELFPPNGPVKSKIEGEVTKERVAKAARKAKMMNFQTTTQVPEFRSELEQLLTQLPLGGSQYLKVNFDRSRSRPKFEFIAIDDMLLPFAATNFYAAERKTHVQYLTQSEYDQRVKDGDYVDAELPSAGGMPPEQTRAEKATDKIEGRSDSSFNQDGLRTIYETQTILDLGANDKSADGIAPYILTIDKTTGKVLALYRNWDEDDDTQEALEHVVEFPFVPWRGAYSIGMTHMIGGLSGAATGALRALLDSAFIQNSQSMIKLKGGTAGGQSVEIQPTQVVELEGGLNVDDVRKLAMPLPYNPPSTVLYQLLGFLVEAGKGVVRTTLDEATPGQNTPVGTELARIEQGMVVYNSIHGRLHAAMARVLGILNRLNGKYLDDAKTKKAVGEVLASRRDFQGPLDVTPVSDPNIFTEAQRFAQTQAVAQRAELHPELYDARKVEELILQTLKVPEANTLLRPGLTPTEENAVAENVKAALGRPVLAYPDQDHIAHLKAHLSFMMSPVLGMSQLIAPSLLPVMIQHIKEHIVFWYAQEVYETASDVATGDDFEAMVRRTKGKEEKQALSRMIAEANLTVVGEAPSVLNQIMPDMQKAMAMAQQLAPPTPQDPAAMVALEDVKMRGKAAADKTQIEAAKLQDKQQERAAEQQGETAREQARLVADGEQAKTQDQLKALDIQARIEMNEDDNRTALEIAGKEQTHVASEGAKDRVHEFIQGAADRGHEVVQGAAERDHALRLAEAQPTGEAE